MTAIRGNSAPVAPSFESDGHPFDAGRPRTAEVSHSARGLWEVLLGDEAQWTKCETLTAARRIADQWAEANAPSEVIVRDAYHRVVQRKSFRDADGDVVS